MVARVALLGIGLLAFLVAGACAANRSEPTDADVHWTKQKQSDEVDQLRYDLLVLEEDVRQCEMWEGSPTGFIGIRKDVPAEFGRLGRNLERVRDRTTDPDVLNVLKSEFLDDYAKLAASPFVARRD